MACFLVVVSEQSSWVLYSNEQFCMDDKFSLNISHIPGSGAGRRKVKLKLGTLHPNKVSAKKKSVIKIKNMDKPCCRHCKGNSFKLYWASGFNAVCLEKQRLKEYLKELPVLGCNSGKYDLMPKKNFSSQFWSRMRKFSLLLSIITISHAWRRNTYASLMSPTSWLMGLVMASFLSLPAYSNQRFLSIRMGIRV